MKEDEASPKKVRTPVFALVLSSIEEKDGRQVPENPVEASYVGAAASREDRYFGYLLAAWEERHRRGTTPILHGNGLEDA